MRKPAALAALLLLSSIASADSNRPLGADEIRAQVKSLDEQVGRCYRDAVGDRAGAGTLDITLEIHRKGIVDRIVVATPGLPAKQAKRVDTCVRALFDGMQFPARRAGTTATLPYSYQRPVNPGPQYSCWSAKGCPGQGDAVGKQAAGGAQYVSAAGGGVTGTTRKSF
jgi:hypothetical protein